LGVITRFEKGQQGLATHGAVAHQRRDYIAARAAIVNAHHRHPLAAIWDGS
jgi:TnpA family transposase